MLEEIVRQMRVVRQGTLVLHHWPKHPIDPPTHTTLTYTSFGFPKYFSRSLGFQDLISSWVFGFMDGGHLEKDI